MSLRPPFFFLVILLVVGLLSCQSQQGSGQPRTDGLPGNKALSKSLFPLTVGKSWSYRSTTYDSLGNRVSSRRDRTTVIKDTVIAGGRWYALQDESTKMPTYASNKPDGLYMLDQEGGEILLYRYPAKVGDECPPYIVMSIDTAVSCSAGRFNCYQYQYVVGGQADSTHSWTVVVDDFVAPGVGLVRHEARREWNNGKGGGVMSGGSEVTELMGM